MSHRPRGRTDDPDSLRHALAAAYQAELMHSFHSAERGFVDEIIDPADTRCALVQGLRMLANKQPWSNLPKHGNHPL